MKMSRLRRELVPWVRDHERIWLMAGAAMAWVVVFGRLGWSSLLDPDEAHYAELTREMIRARSWLVPLLDGRPFIDKPVRFTGCRWRR